MDHSVQDEGLIMLNHKISSARSSLVVQKDPFVQIRKVTSYLAHVCREESYHRGTSQLK